VKRTLAQSAGGNHVWGACFAGCMRSGRPC
jgi:hypothetical protein